MTSSDFQFSFFSAREVDDVVVIEINRTQLTDDENLEQFDHELIQLLGNESGKLLACDLSSVKYMSSSAIGKLIALHRRSTRNGGCVVLCGIQPTVRDILTTSHLLQYFVIASDAETALLQLKEIKGSLGPD